MEELILMNSENILNKITILISLQSRYQYRTEILVGARPQNRYPTEIPYGIARQPPVLVAIVHGNRRDNNHYDTDRLLISNPDIHLDIGIRPRY
ncbi:hypothetical protein L484_005731 [Morus notabilis]|uniref:Uncharacterized protein n=1 Tax=Morus notabilis TaxID=981085 RepID=W9QIT0_9ROSA|nr:hypothetical protein L484_005731 [Morus notabilis]